MAEFDPKLVTDFRTNEPRYSPPAVEPPKPAELDLLREKPVTDPMEEVRRRIETTRPDLHFIPLTPEERKNIPGQPAEGGRFMEIDDIEEEEDCVSEASDIDYERVFKGDGFDSFDYVYDKHGAMVGVVIPKADFDEERRREDNAARFIDEFWSKTERRIGSPIEQADTSRLFNEKESLLKRLKKGLGLHKRPKIHDDDEYA